jgi:MipA family protein
MAMLLATPATMAEAQAQSTAPARAPLPARPPSSAPDRLSVTLGAAPVIGPAWQGSRDMALSIFPDIRVNYGDHIFASVPDGIGWNAINRPGWKIGPLVKLRFGRDEERGGSPFLITGGSDGLQGMGNVGAAGEAGGFVQHDPSRAWRLRAELRHGFGGHQGVVADLSASYRLRIGRAFGGIGPRATFASRDFLQTYFGVDAGQSARSGLAAYRAPSGLVSLGIGGALVRPFDRRSTLTLFGGVDRLGEAAADSPLIRERGQRMQASFGLAYGRRFDL